MELKIFDVEHGGCALLTCDDNTRMMLDAGSNATTGWLPGNYLKQQGITGLEMLTVTNYDEDHVSGIENLFDTVRVERLWRNKSVSTGDLGGLKGDDMGRGIKRLCHAIDNVYTHTAGFPSFAGLQQPPRGFCNSYPAFKDENNLSLVVFLDCHGRGVLFTGDLEYAGWMELLKDPEFRQMLAKVEVLIAPHHGREGGCCAEALALMKSLIYVVVSDKSHMHETQKTVDFYRRYALGGPFRGEHRRVLTTRKDGCITFTFTASGLWRAQ